MISIQELRRLVSEKAWPLEHPFKSYVASETSNPRLHGKSHPYGKLVYSENGSVGGLFGPKRDPKYLIARGADADESIWALAKAGGLIDWGPNVAVDEVDAGWFWLFANPEGRLPQGS